MIQAYCNILEIFCWVLLSRLPDVRYRDSYETYID